MSLLVKAGITKLSELEIDAAKDWAGYDIANFGAGAYGVNAKLASIITKLSELAIDTDKDWQVKGITNLLELASSMQKGDMLVRSDGVIVKITPGSTGTRLTTQGPGALPTWSV